MVTFLRWPPTSSYPPVALGSSFFIAGLPAMKTFTTLAAWLELTDAQGYNHLLVSTACCPQKP